MGRVLLACHLHRLETAAAPRLSHAGHRWLLFTQFERLLWHMSSFAFHLGDFQFTAGPLFLYLPGILSFNCVQWKAVKRHLAAYNFIHFFFSAAFIIEVQESRCV